MYRSRFALQIFQRVLIHGKFALPLACCAQESEMEMASCCMVRTHTKESRPISTKHTTTTTTTTTQRQQQQQQQKQKRINDDWIESVVGAYASKFHLP